MNILKLVIPAFLMMFGTSAFSNYEEVTKECIESSRLHSDVNATFVDRRERINVRVKKLDIPIYHTGGFSGYEGLLQRTIKLIGVNLSSIKDVGYRGVFYRLLLLRQHCGNGDTVKGLFRYLDQEEKRLGDMLVKLKARQKELSDQREDVRELRKKERREEREEQREEQRKKEREEQHKKEREEQSRGVHTPGSVDHKVYEYWCVKEYKTAYHYWIKNSKGRNYRGERHIDRLYEPSALEDPEAYMSNLNIALNLLRPNLELLTTENMKGTLYYRNRIEPCYSSKEYGYIKGTVDREVRKTVRLLRRIRDRHLHFQENKKDPEPYEESGDEDEFSAYEEDDKEGRCGFVGREYDRALGQYGSNKRKLEKLITRIRSIDPYDSPNKHFEIRKRIVSIARLNLKSVSAGNSKGLVERLYYTRDNCMDSDPREFISKGLKAHTERAERMKRILSKYNPPAIEEATNED